MSAAAQAASALALGPLMRMWADMQTGAVVGKRGCYYELRDPPQRRLQRYPRRSTLGGAVEWPRFDLWPALEGYCWPWEG